MVSSSRGLLTAHKFHKFLKMLKDSGMGSPQTISEICDRSAKVSAWLSPSNILDLLQTKETNANFCDSYHDALDQDILAVKDFNMINVLSQTLEKSRFTVEDTITVLKDSCVRCNSFKDAGALLKAFFKTSNSKEEKDKAVFAIATGKRYCFQVLYCANIMFVQCFRTVACLTSDVK